MPFSIRCVVLVLLSVLCCIDSFAQDDCPFKGSIQGIAPNTNLEPVILQLKSAQLFVSHNKKDISPALTEQIQCIIEDLLLADPGEYFTTGCVRVNDYTGRLMVYVQTDNLMAIAYLYRGAETSTHVWVARYEQKHVSVNSNNIFFRDIWFSNGSRVNITTAEQLVDAIVDLYKWNKDGVLRIQLSR